MPCSYRVVQPRNTVMKAMSPGSHAQQHGRRFLHNGRQTSSAVSITSCSYRVIQPRNTVMKAMSPGSHAQQHGRRFLDNGRQTSSAVSITSLRAALPHRCHWLSCRISAVAGCAADWLPARTPHKSRPSTQTPLLRNRVAHPGSNDRPDCLSGVVPRA